MQGAVETKQAYFELGHKSPQGGRVLEDLHINSWSTHKEVASRGDAMSGRDVQPEQGVIGANLKKQHGPLVDDEKVVGQGSQARRGGLALSRQGGGVISGDGDSTGMNEEEAHLYMFDVYNTDNDEVVTFAEAKAGYDADEELK